MRRLFFILSTAFILLTTVQLPLARSSEPITLSLPQSVISEVIAAALPLEVDATSKTLQGSVTILSISDLQLTDDHLACRLHLAGNQLQFLTEVAGHEIRLKVGSVEIDFMANSELRFDQKQQTLFIKPTIKEITASKDAAGGDIGHALVSLLNGKEFPVNMQDMDPIIARTGAKTLTIKTRIADVKAGKEMLRILLSPQVSAGQ